MLRYLLYNCSTDTELLVIADFLPRVEIFHFNCIPDVISQVSLYKLYLTRSQVGTIFLFRKMYLLTLLSLDTNFFSSKNFLQHLLLSSRKNKLVSNHSKMSNSARNGKNGRRRYLAVAVVPPWFLYSSIIVNH